MAELVSKWVGETGKNINKIFANAKSKDAILVFDEAGGCLAIVNLQVGLQADMTISMLDCFFSTLKTLLGYVWSSQT